MISLELIISPTSCKINFKTSLSVHKTSVYIQSNTYYEDLTNSSAKLDKIILKFKVISCTTENWPKTNKEQKLKSFNAMQLLQVSS